jgi:putative ATP-dependent DNA ligase
MNIDSKTLGEAKRKGRMIERDEELQYFSFKEKFKHVPRGTVLLGEQIVPGYRRIGRIFTLERGLARNIKADEVWLEEKIDGYNVRVVKEGKRVYAFSRGGFIEPFTTEKVREMPVFEQFFKSYPNHVVCGEMIGNTPYTRPTKQFDVKFLVFDFMDGMGELLPIAEKYSIIRKFGFESVPVFGKFAKTDLKGMRDVFLAANKAWKEGVVIKAPDNKQAVKYVTPASDIEDISHSAHALFDMPAGFYQQRVLRSAMALKDFGMDRKKHANALGLAFYEQLLRGLDEAAEGMGEKGEGFGGVYDEFEILIRNPETWEGVKKHMSREIKLEEVYRREEPDGRLRIRFRKIFKETTHRLREYMSGKAIED